MTQARRRRQRRGSGGAPPDAAREAVGLANAGISGGIHRWAPTLPAGGRDVPAPAGPTAERGGGDRLAEGWEFAAGQDQRAAAPHRGGAVCGCAPRTGVLPARLILGERRALNRSRRFPASIRARGGAGSWRLGGRLVPPGDVHAAVSACPLDGQMHFHDRHRIVCVLSGSGTVRTVDGRFPARASDVLVFSPDEAHAVAGHPLAPAQLCAVEFVAGAVLSAGEHAMLTEICARRPVIRCGRSAGREARRLVHLLRCEQRRGRAAGAIAQHAYLLALLVLLYRRRPGRERGRRPVDRPLQGIRALMESRFSEPFRVGDLAEMAHLSVRQFTYRFKRAYGVTPLQYLTRLRVAAARDLLCRSDQGVAAIAREVGYENLSHFYRTFTQHTGTSPGRFRRTNTPVPLEGGAEARGSGGP